MPNTVISSASVNSDFDDIADALTESLARDGQGGMQSVLPLDASGFVYNADSNTGMYRTSADAQAIKCGGVDVVDITTAGASVNGDLDVSGEVNQEGAVLLPSGVVISFAGSSIPDGWLLCDGSAVSRTTYARLFVVIGTIYGVGDGTTTFSLPDLRGRVIAALDGGTNRLPGFVALSNSGGASTITLGLSQIPSGITSAAVNSITVVPNGGSNGVPVTPTPGNVVGAFVSGGADVYVPTSTAASWGGTGTFSGNNNINVTSNNTSGGSHSNVQPTMALNFMIKT